MGINAGMMSSNTGVWATPDDFFQKLSDKYGPFDLDPCALPENAKCKRFFTPEQDGLSQEWTGKVFMNPPYGREIGKWVKKASTCGAFVVGLLPARVDTAWWHDYCEPTDYWFVRGRLKFGGHKWNAPFPNAVVIWKAALRGEVGK